MTSYFAMFLCAAAVRHVCVQNNPDAEPGRCNCR